MTICHVLSPRFALIHGDRDLWQRRLVELEELGRQVGLPGPICSARLQHPPGAGALGLGGCVCAAWRERVGVAVLGGGFDAGDQALNIAALHGAWERDDLI